MPFSLSVNEEMMIPHANFLSMKKTIRKARRVHANSPIPGNKRSMLYILNPVFKLLHPPPCALDAV
jgi:hypothetical protein